MNAMNPDLSIVLVMILVWSLYFVLKRSFFNPINQILIERDAAINAAQQEARGKLAEFDRKARAYQDSLKVARLESYRQQENFRAEALRERSQVVAEARKQAELIINSAKREILAQVTTAKQTLEADIDNIANGIVRTILR